MQADLAFMNDGSWGVVNKNWRKTSLGKLDITSVDCPIINTKTVKNWRKYRDLLSKYILPCKITNLPKLLDELESIDVQVIHRTMKG